MPTVTKTFTYSGTLQQVTIPAGTTSIDIYLWGGAGGAGGADAAGGGGNGAAGHHVKKTAYSVTSNIGDTLEVAVGGGGAGGASGGNANGGNNGKGKTQFSGGNGGNSGPSGSSGAGGDNDKYRALLRQDTFSDKIKVHHLFMRIEQSGCS